MGKDSWRKATLALGKVQGGGGGILASVAGECVVIREAGKLCEKPHTRVPL